MSTTYGLRLALVATSLQSLAVLTGCGGAPVASPSPVAAPPAATLAAPRWPAPGASFAALVQVEGGVPVHWEGAMVHCLSPWVDRAAIAAIVAEVGALTGIPQSFAVDGDPSCTVGWTVDPGIINTEDGGHALGSAGFGWDSGRAVRQAQLRFATDRATSIPSLLRHEIGHALGLAHAPGGVMGPAAGPSADYSAAEVEAILWLYGRSK